MDRYALYDFDADALATTTVYHSYEQAEDDASQLDNVLILRLPINGDRPTRQAEQAIGEIVAALYADRDSGELTGENTISEGSCADFVQAVSTILGDYGYAPPV